MNIVIIPCLNPETKLYQIIENLKLQGLKNVIIVDDGSSSQEIFKNLEEQGINVIHHEKNMGKGYSLKTGIKEALKIFPNLTGFIFMDGDGQHNEEDVKKISDLMIKENKIVLGVRDFSSNTVPLRSKIGNKFSSIFFKLTTGCTLSDTQTGLRAIPRRYTNILLNTKGNRYEYEMNFLNYLANHNISFTTTQIETIYEDKNKKSHFNTITDSYRIYEEPIKFIIVSLSSFLIDISLFKIFNNMFKIIIIANIIARLVSGLYNYNMNKYWCFKSYSHNDFLKYLCLFFTQMFLSTTLLKFVSLFGNTYTLYKIIIDATLFIGSYLIQKKYIFKGDEYHEEF
jgi:putative flippase GtrA/choline kinase